jgi:hypothetical protein
MYVCCRPAQVVKLLYAVAILFSYGLQFYIPTSIIWPTIEEKVPKGLENVAQNSFRVVTVVFTGKSPWILHPKIVTSIPLLATGYSLLKYSSYYKKHLL